MRFAAANVINAVDVLQYSSIHVTTTDKKNQRHQKKNELKIYMKNSIYYGNNKAVLEPTLGI